MYYIPTIYVFLNYDVSVKIWMIMIFQETFYGSSIVPTHETENTLFNTSAFKCR